MSDGFPEPPLGLGYLMGVARKRGFEYEFYDEDHHGALFPLDRLMRDFAPEVCVVSFMTPQCFIAAGQIRAFKQMHPEVRIIVGGPHPSALPVETMRDIPEIDYLCKGEGEKTFGEFLDFLSGTIALEEIKGLFWRSEGGDIRVNPPRDLMPAADLDAYGVDWEKILEHGPYRQRLAYTPEIREALAIITSRGCPFECTFCDEASIWNRRVRNRSIDNVVAEIEWLVRTYGIRDFNILDDTFTLKKSRVAEFCARVAPLGIRFKITAKTTTVDAAMLAALKAAGCQLIAYGVESGDQEVLDRMKKQQTLDEVRTAFALTREAGIISFALCMVGNFGEDLAAVKKTAQFIRELDPDMASGALMTPYPGSENWHICNSNGWILHRNWEHWVPSALKTKSILPVARTDKLDANELVRAYYFINRYILRMRFGRKYGRLFALHPAFYLNEILPRMRTIGPLAFFHHLANMALRRVGRA